MWSSKLHLKKMAILGACSDPADPVVDNGLQRVLLSSLQRGDEVDRAGLSGAGSEHDDLSKGLDRGPGRVSIPPLTKC